MIKRVKPPWEPEIQFPEFDMLDLELERTARLRRRNPEMPWPSEEEPPQDGHIIRHRREAEVKPELGGLIW